MKEIYETSVLGQDISSWNTAGENSATARWRGFLDSFEQYGADGFCLWAETSVAPFEQTVADLRRQGLSDDAVLIFETAHWNRLKPLIEAWIAARGFAEEAPTAKPEALAA